MTPRIITARNVNHALPEALAWLRIVGINEPSRNGPCLVAPGPVITEYEYPAERILWNATRDANPVFHLMEAIWMLGGHDEVEHLTPFNSNFEQYAEPNGIVHGAYGYRWRAAFMSDQLEIIINMLREDPNTRRAVLQMWHCDDDLGENKRDIPCNTHIYFDLRGNKLNMTVCCRSNDILWGAYGANVVHMSILQEFIARALDVPMGLYRQMSNNFHIYTDLPMAKELLDSVVLDPDEDDEYSKNVRIVPLLARGEDWRVFLYECREFFNRPRFTPFSFFLNRVAYPLRKAYLVRKEKGPYQEYLETVPECDWKLAFQQWVARREK